MRRKLTPGELEQLLDDQARLGGRPGGRNLSDEEVAELHRLMLERGPTLVLARVEDRRGADRTGTIETTSGAFEPAWTKRETSCIGS